MGRRGCGCIVGLLASGGIGLLALTSAMGAAFARADDATALKWSATLADATDPASLFAFIEGW